MIDVSRRHALAMSGFAALASLLKPGVILAADAAGEKPLWDLSDLYPSIAAWDAARKDVAARIPGLAAWKGRLGESAQTLLDALSAQSKLGNEIDRLSLYASLMADSDVRDAAAQERNSQADDLYAAYGSATAWTSPELVALGAGKLNGFLAQNTQLKARFDHYLDDTIRQAAHTLSPEGEEVLALSGPPLSTPSDVQGQLRSSDLPWPTVTLSDGRKLTLDSQGYANNRDLPNRADRKAVMDAFFGAHAKFQNTFGAAYAGQIKGDIFRAKARHYKTSLERALSNYNVPEAVYRTLVSETNAGLPTLHRYFRLRQKMLKLPDLFYYDIYPPLVSLDKTFTLDQMRANTLAAVRPLGPEYQKLIATGTAAKWMDPWPRPGKRPGAYVNGIHGVHPYVLLNLSNKYDGQTTYAHEWGHAIHSLLATANQPLEKSGYPIFLAEIASTLNENLLAAHMLKTAKTREEKLFYLGQQMENFRATFFRQAMFAEFELIAHDKAEAGEGLSGEKFGAIYLDLLKRYHGDAMTIDPLYANEWSYIPHFYRSFYVYQYATCIAAGTYFSSRILSGGAAERDNYLAVLKAGGSDYPTEILKRAGVDMATPAPYKALVATFDKVMDQAEALLA